MLPVYNRCEFVHVILQVLCMEICDGLQTVSTSHGLCNGKVSPDPRNIACKDKASSLTILVCAKCLTMDTDLLSRELPECLTENISHFKCFYCSVMQLQYWALKLLFWTLSLGNGDCLGYRKPKQPYQWLTYKQVSIVNDRLINLGYSFVTLKWGNNYLAGFRQN